MFSDGCHNRGQKDARASRVSAEGKYVTDTQQRRRRTEERRFATCTSATHSAKQVAGKTSILSLLIIIYKSEDYWQTEKDFCGSDVITSMTVLGRVKLTLLKLKYFL